MRIITWNVDGYDQAKHEWLKNYILSNECDIIFLTETKKNEAILKNLFSTLTEYDAIINSHSPSNIHGVAMLIKKCHKYEVSNNFLVTPRKDTRTTNGACGRVIHIRLTKSNMCINFVGTYVPNSGRSDEEKLNYRVEVWDKALQTYLNSLNKEHNSVVLFGDINVALDDIDVSNPSSMKRYAGFTPRERENFKEFLSEGNFFDIYRKQHPEEKGYSWVSDNRRDGHGMRLDNFLVTHALIPKIKDTFIISECPLSDHVPIGINLN